MKSDIIEAYVSKVYGYAINHTYTREEADELSQEILFTVVRELPKLRDESRFEPWLWGIAARVMYMFRRNMGKKREVYSFDELYDFPAEEEDGHDWLCDKLRAEISMMSSIYRDIVIFYYYDGLSVKNISARLGIPEGTVTWRLSEARRKLKKECEKMEESALRPVKMKLDIYGSGNYNGRDILFPDAYISDALSQNILYHVYEEPKTVEELAKLCGVPAFYIEDRIDNLVRREAVIQPAKGKYQTGFILWSDKHGIYCEENAGRVIKPLEGKMFAALKLFAADADKLGFYNAGKSSDELIYLYGVMVFSYLSRKFCTLPYPEIDPKYDGNRWCYIGNMESGKHRRTGIGEQASLNQGSRGSYAHFTYAYSDFTFRPMMTSDEINVCEDILTRGETSDSYHAAEAIKNGYIEKRDGKLFVAVPAFTKEQKTDFDSYADNYFAPLAGEYGRLVENFAAGFAGLFPKHLSDDAARMSRNFYFGLYDGFVRFWQQNEVIEKPSLGSVCDVLVQFK